MMDKIFQNKWVLRALSIILAILLFGYVRNTHLGISTSTLNPTTSVVTEVTLNGVPIFTNHPATTYVSGLPEHVQVKLIGPRNIVQRMSVNDIQVLAEGLENLPAGEHTIQLTVRGVPESVTAVVEPSNLTLTIDRTVSLEKDVAVNVDTSALPDAFMTGTPVVNPQRVTLSGSEATMAKVATATVTVTVEETQTGNIVLQNQKVQVRDANNELLDVSVNQDVNVTIPIIAYSTTVPVTYALQGEGNANYHYVITDQRRQTVTVSGSKAILDGLTSLTAVININSITATGSYPATVQLPQGVTLTGGNIQVEITVTPKESSSESQSAPPESSQSSDATSNSSANDGSEPVANQDQE